MLRSNATDKTAMVTAKFGILLGSTPSTLWPLYFYSKMTQIKFVSRNQLHNTIAVNI